MAFKFFRRIFEKIKGYFTTPSRPAETVAREDWAESGEWLSVGDTRLAANFSTYVTAIRYDKYRKHLAVRFTTGGRCTYPDIDISVAQAMVRAPSLGRFVRSELYHRPYLEKFGHRA